MSTETEIKLLFDGGNLRRLEKLELVRSRQIGRGRRHRLRSTYFDTPDGRLREEGLTLRVRHDGSRYVQTVKTAATGGREPFARGEWEHEVAGERPVLNGADGSPLPAALEALKAGPEALLPQLTVEAARRTVLLQLGGGSTVEMAFDRGHIAAGTKSQPLAEAELELKSGQAAALFAFARELLNELPFRLEHRSKADRGFALLQGEPGARWAEAPSLDTDLDVEAAFKLIASVCLQQITANEPVALGGADPEGVHQLRVGIRRLRSALSVFGRFLPQAPRTELRDGWREVMAAFGPAREWDVLLEETLKPLMARVGEDPGLKRLNRIATTARQDGYAGLRQMVTSPHYVALKLSLMEFLVQDWAVYAEGLSPPPWSQPVAPFADRILDKRQRQLRRIGDRHENMSLDQLHELRIAAKKLRYAAEFFRSLYPKKRVRRYVGALAAMQDCLGAVNDGFVGRKRISEAWDKLGGLSRRSTRRARAEGAVEGWFAAVDHVELAAFAKAWRRYREADRFWRKPAPLKRAE